MIHPLPETKKTPRVLTAFISFLVGVIVTVSIFFGYALFVRKDALYKAWVYYEAVQTLQFSQKLSVSK